MIQEARHELEAHGMSQEDVAEGIGADPGSPTVQYTSPSETITPAGLQLWLKADAGITNLSYDYTSQIILDGTVAGTFVATSIPTWNAEENHMNGYNLINGVSTILFFYDGSEPRYDIRMESYQNGGSIFYAGYFSIYNTTSWATYGNWKTPPTISGLTNALADGNGLYGYEGERPNEPDFGYVLGVGGSDVRYYIFGSPGAWGLFYVNTGPDGESYQIASNANDYPNGTWTMLVEGVGTAFGSGSDWAINPTPPTGVSSALSPLVSTDYIETWADQSVNNRSPAYRASGVASYATIAGNAFVSFPANTNLYLFPVVLGAYTGTIFVVSRFAASTQGSLAMLFFQEEGFQLARGYDMSNVLWFANGADAITSNLPVDNNTNYVLEATFDNDLANLYINGMATGSGPMGGAIVGNNTYIGGYEPSNMAEIIVYDRVLTTAERQQVEAYLAQKYSITLS